MASMKMISERLRAALPVASSPPRREEVARLAAVSGRSVSNVRKILSEAHPRVLQALQSGILKINGAVQLCRKPRDEQLNEFVSMTVTREIRKHLRQLTADRLKGPLAPPVADVLEMLRRSNEDRPGSVQIRIVDFQQTIVLLGQELLSKASGPEVRTA
jgi:DNA-binding transcriptional ArsR family regulator